MKFLASFALFAVAASINIPLNSMYDDQWENFKMKFGKHYDGQEEASRRMTWERQMEDIMKHNEDCDNGLHSYKRAINKFSDMENEEFLQLYTGYRDDGKNGSNGMPFIMLDEAEVPDTVDWRDQGLVTDVKDQAQCGSCWAFSATGSLEGQQAKKTGQLVSLSEQNLVDCSKSEGTLGCSGGWMNDAFEYIKKNGGIDTEDSYPYTAQEGDCQYNPENVGAMVTGYVDIPSGDEEALKNAVATIGPISIAFDAGHNFQSYQSGVYDEPNCAQDQFSHAVTVVGYGNEDGKDYWLMKNSWGQDWGDNGYVKMSRNKDNQCGVASKASYPTV